jgi:nitrate reductase (NAD(P)H)
MMPEYHIGTLDEEAKKRLHEKQEDTNDEPRPTFLNPKSWLKAPLTSKKDISWDTKIFTFDLQHPTQTLGLPVGQHLMMKLTDAKTKEAIIRSYTPISEISDQGKLHILVKIYYGTDQAPGGKMTVTLDSCAIGESIEFKGPIGKFEYKGKGNVEINGKPRKVKKFGMICGGSGITPIFQVLRAIMQDDEDQTQCVVLNGNRLIEDILCKEDLDKYEVHPSKKCKMLHTLTQAPETWQGLRGRISHDLVREHIEMNGDTMILICGPPAMEKTIKSCLEADKWPESDIVLF